MPFNPLHYRKTWAALGTPLDPPTYDVAAAPEQSAISLLKGILAAVGGGVPVPDHSISFVKLQQVTGPCVMGRGPANLGDVQTMVIGTGLRWVSASNTLEVTGVGRTGPFGASNTWMTAQFFQGPINVLDTDHFNIACQSNTSKRMQFDLSTMNPSTLLMIQAPFVGNGFLALMQNGNSYAQPLDGDLTALSNLGGTDTIYYRSGGDTWSPVTIGSNLTFSGGILSATAGGGGGGGSVNTAGPVNASMLAAFADATGTLIQGVTVPGPGLAYGGGQLTIADDLAAIENLTGTNTIYYRSGTSLWSAVTMGAGMIFSAGTLAVNNTLQVLGALTPSADTLPYFTGTPAAALTALTSFARTLLATATAAAALTVLGAQAADDDLAALSALTGTNTIYYRNGVGSWAPVTIGANLTFTGGTLSATGGAGGGVSTSGPVTATMLTGYADATGNLIQGITLPVAGIARSGGNLVLANDLAALEGLTGTSTIYYRSGADAWSAVTIGSGLSFAGGTLSATGGAGAGDVVSSGTGFSTSTLAGYADATGDVIRAITMPASGIALAGNAMVLTNDLASLEAATATNAIYYRSAADTWSTVTVGGGLGFADGNLTVTNTTLTALAAVTPSADTFPYFTSGTAASAAAITAAARTLLSQTTNAAMLTTLGGQPLDADLTSLASAANTNAMYYRSAANTWSPVTIGTGISFTGGTLSGTSGGGDVFKATDNIFTASNYFTGPRTVMGHNAEVGHVAKLQIHGATALALSHWSADSAGSSLFFNKSRNATIGTHTIVNDGDTLGSLTWQGSDGTVFRTAAQLIASVQGTPSAGLVPGGFGFNTRSAAGALNRCMTINADGTTTFGSMPFMLYGNLVEINSISATQGVGLQRWTADATGSMIALRKSRGTSVNIFSALITSDIAGNIQFEGATNSGFVPVAKIFAAVQDGLATSRRCSVAITAYTQAAVEKTCLTANAEHGVQLLGTTVGDNAPAGYVGEHFQFTAAELPLTDGAWSSGNSWLVPPGDWDICADAVFWIKSGQGVNNTLMASLSTTGAPTSALPWWSSIVVPSLSGQFVLHIGPTRVNVVTQTTYHVFHWHNCGAAANVTGWSSIRGRRVR